MTANVNIIGLTRDVYKGLPTTLCAGCGHNSITNHLIKALYEYGVEPHNLAKMSGIGCSSKTPAYFVEQAHGFNSLHGRMPSAATGAKLANRELMVLGISGDGDTASIGLGQYCHLIRRNVDCTYIVENNGCYGLTKGQFSATADVGSKQKSGKINEYATIDVCGLAIQLGATFVARSFSGDGKQLVPLLQAAFSHRGTAILDIISPCVTFNDHEGSTKSYQYVKDHDVVLHTADYISGGKEIAVDYEPGTVHDVQLDDGSHLLLRKLDTNHDPTDAIGALRTIHDASARGEFVTGLLYVDTHQQDLCARERLTKVPLARLDEKALRMHKSEWSKLMESF
ncbi:MAG: 2-oxoacid:ferredoxin oxidoreductase subunit beta [Candidatus Eremiobacteraeota bacterium]|nr:2-oxoacid:ferredoxin oxidoreductase subunit beta [Candidatus Eremiobacteraeota bacterium]MBV8284698.1 2-oxoacid:ferredoxin oxidoreductase subunit beta [Candidatus Eremiobacteraeota bacterium]MBV8583845.1 2-oxoacid:ferredoxin oxidoreductase subunit beta [Candidatus Eremiobacteraeota bacterium]